SIPIRAEQGVTFTAPGDVILNLEGRTLTPSGGGLHFTLFRVDAGPGSAIPLRSVMFRTEVSSASRARLELYAFTLPSPGPYVLRVSGLEPERDYSGDAIVFTRPVGASVTQHVFMLLVLGAVFVGCLVVSGLSLREQTLEPARVASAQATARRATLEDALARSAA